MFSEGQIAMLQTFADQAVIAIENTRLFKELQTRNQDLTESLEQQTATSEILRVISQSQRDVQPVFEVIAANARKLCRASTGGVAVFDGELIRHVAHDGGTPEQVEATRRTYPMQPGRGGAMARAVLTRTVVHIPDVQVDQEYRLHAYAQTFGYRSTASVPMLHNGSPIGAISVTGTEPAMFSERQIAMLQTFADQAVIAIENTRLFNELQTRNRDLTESLEQQTATSEILRAISQSQSDVQPVFETIARECAETLRSNVRGGLHVRRQADSLGGCARHQPGYRSISAVLPDGHKSRQRYHPCDPDSSHSLHPGHSPGRGISAADLGSERRLSQRAFRPHAPRGQPDRSDWRHRSRARDVLREPDRHAPDLRRPGGDRDREYATVQ